MFLSPDGGDAGGEGTVTAAVSRHPEARACTAGGANLRREWSTGTWE